MQKPLRALFPVVFLISVSFLQAQTPYIKSANNTASYDSTAIAQGSMFVIFGNTLGPGVLVPAPPNQFPLPLSLAGSSVTVTSGNITLNCPMFYTSFGQVVAVMPSNTPLGTATVSVTFNNKSSGPNSATVNVVASSVGIFTPGATGLGLGIFTDALTGAPITAATPAIPGEILTGWVTGVGALAGYDNAIPPPAALVNSSAVQVWVGGQAAQMSYAGRSGCCVAVDQLNFYVPPQAAMGCTIPVNVSSSGRTSATTTIPISSANNVPCSDSGPTLPTSQLISATAGKPLKFGVVTVAPSTGHKSPVHLLQVADRLSTALHVPVSVDDAEKIMLAAQTRNSKALRSAMSKYASQWKALTPKAKARLADAMAVSLEVNPAALFGAVTNEGLVASALSAQMAPPGVCVIVPSPLPTQFDVVTTGFDAGASISLIGAAGSITLPRKSLGNYQPPSNGSLAVGGAIPVGTYTFAGSGGADIGPFSVTVTVSAHPSFTNKAALASIDRSVPLTVTWTGGVAGQFVLIVGSAGDSDTGLPAQVPVGKRGFSCVEDATKGTLTIQPYILQSMWPTPDGSGALVIATDPFTSLINIPGLDLASFVDASTDLVSGIVFK